MGLGWFISGALEEGSDGLGVLLGDPLDILPISYKKIQISISQGHLNKLQFWNKDWIKTFLFQ